MFRFVASRCLAAFTSLTSKSHLLALAAGLGVTGSVLIQNHSHAQAGTYSRQAVVPGMQELAAEYRAVVQDLNRFSTMNYGTLDDVRRTSSVVAGYDPKAVAQGWFAYHAIQVARQEKFRIAVRKLANHMGKDVFLTRIDHNPSVLRTHPGTKESVAFIMDAINWETAQLAAVGDLVESRMQELRSARLGRKTVAKHSRSTTPADLVARYRRRHIATPAEAYPVIDRVLGLAARRALDAIDGPNIPKVLSLASERSMNQCVRFSRLNLVQCVAATRFPEEEAMCLGRYGMNALSECWSWMLES